MFLHVEVLMLISWLVVIDGDTNSMLGGSTSEDGDWKSGGCALE